MPEHFDVIVIGSGAGGGTLTHALAPTGKRILPLERGDFLPRELESGQVQENRQYWGGRLGSPLGAGAGQPASQPA